MKTKFLKIDTPCKENWDNMSLNEKGRFCEICSKTLIDFTQKNGSQIIKEINNNENLCVRLTSEQERIPFVEIKKNNENKLPYSNVAVGLMIVTSLSFNQTSEATNVPLQADLEQTSNNDLCTDKSINTSTLKRSTLFSGQITSENGEVVENAKITFITINQIFSTYTLKDGTFSIKIPKELIDDENVVRVSYDQIINHKTDNKKFVGYETTDYVLTKHEISSEYDIKATRIRHIIGKVRVMKDDETPVVLSDGKEMNYNEFMDAKFARNNTTINLENKVIYFFKSESAVALYGEKAKYGLYILMNKE
ncbi:carboxypeptidase-like regulatory domain-containing protein [Flammeovirga agarivorans]|uniref:Carboxypeptidase regulatory-like domain-containing protein n=1 Tax=Flammeovirga agarivorans TaxID=2726742 RepID=A0A7X8SJK9_9BACT|nr:carboxypeptidase-like regulatory domain-containing protein [Flammeovirga agarivorans]NLR91401.1 carboxypeptidase regulatory-like domain-containing protein [Flammeovirga agarivorans]